MLSLEAVRSRLLSILPFHPDKDLLEELFYCSSSIEFSERGEKLFSPGDAPKGFYWILKGTASLRLSSQKEIALEEGDFIGFDNFISSEGHRFPVVTEEADVHTIFIDRKCYNLFAKEPDLSLYILHQHLKQLIRLKNDLGPSLAS